MSSTVMGSTIAANAIDVDIYARGEAGRGIESTTRKYQYSTDGQNYPTTGTWLDTIPAIQKGKYLWTQNTENYTDGTHEDSYSVVYMPTDGVTPTLATASGSHINEVGTPTVSTSKSGATTTFTFDYLKGQTGQTGPQGYSPRASVSKSGNTATITITDQQGTTTTQIYDGTGSGDMRAADYVNTGGTGVVLKAQTANNATNADKVNNLTVQTAVPANAVFTDTNNAVTQTATTASANYELLFSSTADNTTRTEGARKTSTLTYNPSTKALVTGGTVNGFTLADAAAKTVDTSITANSSSTGLPTSAAVATFVEGKGYTTTDANVLQTVTAASSSDTHYPLLTTTTNNASATATTSTRFMNGVYLNSKDSSLNAPSIKATTITQNGVAVSTNAVLYGTANPTSSQGKIGDIYVQISS